MTKKEKYVRRTDWHGKMIYQEIILKAKQQEEEADKYKDTGHPITVGYLYGQAWAYRDAASYIAAVYGYPDIEVAT